MLSLYFIILSPESGRWWPEMERGGRETEEETRNRPGRTSDQDDDGDGDVDYDDDHDDDDGGEEGDDVDLHGEEVLGGGLPLLLPLLCRLPPTI